MPLLIKTLDQIMHEQQNDVYVLVFPIAAMGRELDLQAQQDHFAWFRTRKLSYETAAPRGWLSGNPARYAIYFDVDDPRVAEYNATFENAEGLSRRPDSYQMYLQSYAAWQKAGGEKHWVDEQNRSQKILIKSKSSLVSSVSF